MPRRPDPAEFDRPLSRAELAERQRRLSMLSPHHVADAYRQAHEACRMDGDRLPRASAVQELGRCGRCCGGGGVAGSLREVSLACWRLGELKVEYIVNMAANAVLKRKVESAMKRVRRASKISGQTEHVYGECRHGDRLRVSRYQRCRPAAFRPRPQIVGGPGRQSVPTVDRQRPTRSPRRRNCLVVDQTWPRPCFSCSDCGLLGWPLGSCCLCCIGWFGWFPGF